MSVAVRGESARADQSTEVWHYWVVKQDWDKNIPLCAEARGDTDWRFSRERYVWPIGVTIEKAKVTCGECLEWLHS